MFNICHYVQLNFTFKKKCHALQIDSNPLFYPVYLKNKSWKPECVGSFNMDWWILVFYPEPEAMDIIYYYPPIHVKTQNTFWLP